MEDVDGGLVALAEVVVRPADAEAAVGALEVIQPSADLDDPAAVEPGRGRNNEKKILGGSIRSLTWGKGE